MNILKKMFVGASVFASAASAASIIDIATFTADTNAAITNFQTTEGLTQFQQNFFPTCDEDDRCSNNFKLVKRLSSLHPVNTEIASKYTGSGWENNNPNLFRTPFPGKGITVVIDNFDNEDFGYPEWGVKYKPGNPLNAQISNTEVNFNEANGVLEVVFTLDYDKPVEYSCEDSFCNTKGDYVNFDLAIVVDDVQQDEYAFTALGVDYVTFSSGFLENSDWFFHNGDVYSVSNDATLSNNSCVRGVCRATVHNSVQIEEGYAPIDERLQPGFYGSIHDLPNDGTRAFNISFHGKSVLGMGGIIPVPENNLFARVTHLETSFDETTNTLDYAITFQYNEPEVTCTRGGCLRRAGFNYNMTVNVEKVETPSCHEIVSVNEEGKLVFTIPGATSDNVFVGGYNNGQWFFNYLSGLCETTENGQVCTSEVIYNGGDVTSRFEGQGISGYYLPGPTNAEFFSAFNAANCQ